MQAMKPIYEGCMEKGVQHVTTQATAQIVSAAASSRSHANGKVKSSWNYANNSSSNNNNIESSIDHQQIKSQVKIVHPTSVVVNDTGFTANPVKDNQQFASNKKKSKKLKKNLCLKEN